MTSYGSDLEGASGGGDLKGASGGGDLKVASGGGDLDDAPTAEYNYDLASDGGDLDDAPTAEYNYDREDVTRAQTTLSSATDRESGTSSADCESDTSAVSAADRESDTCLPPWILLDPVSYIDEDLSYDNATTTKAQTVSWREDGVKVSFFVANPPCPSHFSIHVPSIIEKPYMLCGRPTIVCTVGNLAVISVTFDGYKSEIEYFLYRVVGPGRRPSLIHLDYISQQLKRVIHVVKVGILLREGDGEGGFVLAALALEEAKGEQYRMHVFCLEHGAWINKVERLQRHQIGSMCLHNVEKVIVISDRELGFIDFWNGILVFDVLHENLTPRYIPLPTLLPGNQSDDQLGLSGKYFRDVVFSTHGILKCVELEMSWKQTVHCSTESKEKKDTWDIEMLYDTELIQHHQILEVEETYERYEYMGWRLICWSRISSSDGWRKDCSIHAKDMIAESQICDLFVSFPTLSMDGNEVYVVSKVHTGDLESHVFVVDLEEKSLKKFSLFPTKRRDLFQQAYIASDLFKYMNKPADDKEKPTHLRFLVSNTAAGCIIGKGGSSTINDFQSQSGARIQLSRSHEFFPGTNDIIIMVSGLFDEVMKAMELILEKLLAEGEEFNEAEARPKVRLVVPNSSCGGIIGKGGATIKSFIEDSHAGIKISPQDNNYVGLHDRLVTVTGTFDDQMNAIDVILKKLSEDVHYPPNLSSPFPYEGLAFPSYPGVPVGYMIPQVPFNNAVNYGPNNGYGGRYQNNKPSTPMRSPASNEAQESLTIDDKEKPTHLRFLVSNTAAGCIIGKGGSTINDFQSQSGARIQLSRSHEFFPGTNDRIIMVSGLFDEVMKAMELILEKLLAEGEEFNEAEARPKVRLVVPNSSCGGIIGKGGATIKSFIEDSHAGIKISPQDNNYVGLHDRLVTVTGTFDDQMNAIDVILKKLSEDVHYPPNLSSPFPYEGLPFSSYPAVPVGYMIPQVPFNNAVNYGPNKGYGRRYQNNKPSTPMRSPASNEPQESLTIGIADEHIGAVVGRAGRNITEIIQASGARIKISDRGDFISGTSDRKVTITGTTEAIQTAESMIMQRVSASSER